MTGGGVNLAKFSFRFFITLAIAGLVIVGSSGNTFASHDKQTNRVVRGIQDSSNNQTGIFQSLKNFFSGFFAQADSQKPSKPITTPKPVQTPTPTLRPNPIETPAPSATPKPTPTPAPAPKPTPVPSVTQFLPLSGGKVTGKSTFNQELTLLEGFRVGTGGLLVNTSGALTTSQAIKVGDVEIIGKDGKIASFTSSYFGSLDGSAITNVNAAKIGGLLPGVLLRSDEGDTAEGAIKFTSKPGGSGVADGPVYINPASAPSNGTLLGVAVDGTSKFKVDAEGDISFAGDAQFGDDITSSATTVNLLNTGVETLNIGGAATLLNFADSTATKTIDIGGVTASGADTINIATHRSTADAIAIGNDNASTTVAITGGDDWQITGTGLLTLSASAAQTTAIDITDSDYTNAISIADNAIIGTTANLDLTNFDVTGSSGDITTGGDIAVNGGDLSTTAATFNVANAATTLNLGSTNVTRTIAIGTGTNADTINIGTGATTADSISIGTGAVANTIAIGSSSATTVSIIDDNWSIGTGGAAVLVSLNLGTTTLLDVVSGTSSIDFGATAASTCEESGAITLTGAATGDSVHVGTPASPAANSAIWGYVSAADTVRVRRCNVSVSALADPAAETYRITVTKF
ncbi:MAG: hypothetical protein WAP74_01020 [Patescibacteria group bacterium]